MYAAHGCAAGATSTSHHSRHSSQFYGRREMARSGERENSVHNDGSRLVPISEGLNDAEVVKCGLVSVLKADSTWATRLMTLSKQNLCFSEAIDDPNVAGKHRVVNFVPLQEVVSVRYASAMLQDSFSSFRNGSVRVQPNQQLGSPLARAMSSSIRGTMSSRGSHKKLGSPSTDTFELHTLEAGHNGGRTFTVRSEEECEQWVEAIQAQSKKRYDEVHNHSRYRKWQGYGRNIYRSVWFQAGVALVVLVNFVFDALQAEYEPKAIADSGLASPIYEVLDVLFTSMFVLELGLNLWGHWFWDFVTNGWSMFDLFIIIISVGSIVLKNLASISLLRVFRAIRVLRLVKRFESLRLIVEAISKSIVPVLSALLMVVLMTSIFTIFGVYLFAEESPADFGTFSLSMCTLFRVMAFSTWPNDVHAVSYDEETGTHQVVVKVWVFIILFTAVVSWTCLQVVVAVLLDNFMQVTATFKADRIKQKHVEKRKGRHHPIDGLMAELLESAETQKELSVLLQSIFGVIDEDETGSVCFEELRDGLKKLNIEPMVVISEEDYAVLTEDGVLCDADGRISCDIFCAILLRAMHSYAEKTVSDTAALHADSDDTVAILHGIRLLLMDRDHATHGAIKRAQAAADDVGAGGGQHWSGADAARRHSTTPTDVLLSERGPPLVFEAESGGGHGVGVGVGSEGESGMETRMARMEAKMDAMAAKMDARMDTMAEMLARCLGGAGSRQTDTSQLVDSLGPRSQHAVGLRPRGKGGEHGGGSAATSMDPPALPGADRLKPGSGRDRQDRNSELNSGVNNPVDLRSDRGAGEHSERGRVSVWLEPADVEPQYAEPGVVPASRKVQQGRADATTHTRGDEESANPRREQELQRHGLERQLQPAQQQQQQQQQEEEHGQEHHQQHQQRQPQPKRLHEEHQHRYRRSSEVSACSIPSDTDLAAHGEA